MQVVNFKPKKSKIQHKNSTKVQIDLAISAEKIELQKKGYAYKAQFDGSWLFIHKGRVCDPGNQNN